MMLLELLRRLEDVTTPQVVSPPCIQVLVGTSARWLLFFRQKST